jgi:hypothetical protein
MPTDPVRRSVIRGLLMLVGATVTIIGISTVRGDSAIATLAICAAAAAVIVVAGVIYVRGAKTR